MLDGLNHMIGFLRHIACHGCMDCHLTFGCMFRIAVKYLSDEEGE